MKANNDTPRSGLKPFWRQALHTGSYVMKDVRQVTSWTAAKNNDNIKYTDSLGKQIRLLNAVCFSCSYALSTN